MSAHEPSTVRIFMKLVQYSKALADETRVRLLHVLHHFELNVGEIVSVMAMGQSRISRHLKILAESGLLEFRRDGLWVFYRSSTRSGVREYLQCLSGLMESEASLQHDLVRARTVVRERISSTRQFFDSIAQEWAELSRDVLGDFDVVGEISSRLSACTVAVDLGCGPGILLAALKDRADAVIGVDSSSKMLEVAEKRFRDDDAVSLRIGDLEHLPLKDQEADAAVMSMVLHHLAHPRKVWEEVARILKPGGRAVLVDFCRHSNETMRSTYGDRWLGFDPEELEEWFALAGLKTVETRIFPVNKGLSVVLMKAEKSFKG
jgi:ArsR family transcriptional regulator